MKDEVAVLDSPPLIVRKVSVDVNQRQRKELRSCVKVDVAVLGSPSLINLIVSVAVKTTLNSNSH